MSQLSYPFKGSYIVTYIHNWRKLCISQVNVHKACEHLSYGANSFWVVRSPVDWVLLICGPGLGGTETDTNDDADDGDDDDGFGSRFADLDVAT